MTFIYILDKAERKDSPEINVIESKEHLSDKKPPIVIFVQMLKFM